MKRIIKFFSALKITLKFGLGFSILVLVLFMETILGFHALSSIRASNDAIVENVEMQRLALGVSANWEQAQRYQQSYIHQILNIGVEQAYEQYALPVGVEITEVIRDLATIKRYLREQNDSEGVANIEAELDALLSSISTYATSFEETTILMQQDIVGMKLQLDYSADNLLRILETNSQATALITEFYKLRYWEKSCAEDCESNFQELLRVAESFSKSIENSSLSSSEKLNAQLTLGEYRSLASEMHELRMQTTEKQSELDMISESVEPILINLMVFVDTEVGEARLQIEENRRAAVRQLASSMIIGLLIAIGLGFAFHSGVTKKIVSLTKTAREFHDGNLAARSHIGNSDEFGELSNTFNNMADKLQSLTIELREQAIRDSLTGLFNRRYLDETLPREINRALRADLPVTLVIIDLDNLKEVNDQFGHAVGDQMLIELGKILGSDSRSGDIACRYGGDEFVVVMPGANCEDSNKRVEHWLQLFHRVEVVAHGFSVKSSFSAGIVTYQQDEKPQKFVARADAALYEAKESGRHCIQCG